ncbi:hypothetical protein C5167_005395 [Papaver somniferum]|uniref:Dynein light chain n=1 Tax=Papaver somniferum TaxID=3469 RepID=A0A4Y7JBB1_PAPSO|nr:dynein light chain, cytoplasmic-like [Papaver somniferum]RZC58097.1 hypothetical protein C5167_005395 [Papaver somniferum]
MDRTASDTTTAAKEAKIKRTLSSEVMKLATLAVELNITVRSANMHVAMQEKAFIFTRKLLTVNKSNTKNTKPTPTQIALAIKKEFDASYGPAWHCIVGKSFGSFVTHSPGGFLYFSIDNLYLLLFKTEVQPVMQ